MKWYLHPIGGYLMASIYNPDTRRNRTIYQHRLVWEICHGPIPKEAVIHHKNGIKTDNRIENLELMPSHSAHRMWHFNKANPLGKKQKKKALGVVRSCLSCGQEFATFRTHKKYCSVRCRRSETRKRFRQRYPGYATAAWRRWNARKKAA